jgi:hypothetical protein
MAVSELDKGAIPPQTAWSCVIIKENLFVKLVTKSWLWDLVACA